MKLRDVLVLAAMGLVSCDGKPETEPPAAPHVHEHHAPHGGALQVLGDEAAHVELFLDAKTGKLTAYVLDGEAEKPVRIAQPSLDLTVLLPVSNPLQSVHSKTTIQLAAVANPLTGETVGDTSQFEAVSDKLRGVESFFGTLDTITARGVKFDAVPVAFPVGNEQDAKHAAK